MKENTSYDVVALVGRILLALMFLLAGWSKIGGFEGTAGYIASKGLPMAQLLAGATIVLELGAGLALVAGFKARWAALALAVFTLLASVIFHAFWAVPAEARQVQNLMFMKNIAITGGLLMVLAFGPGRFSVDGRR
jgi:putative oxidoreductase